jgi:hypothetical protein
MSSRRVSLGFFAAPSAVLSPFILVIAFRAPAEAWPALPIFAVHILLVAYVVTVLIGLPVHLILRAKDRHGLADYVGATAVAASLAALLVDLAGNLLSSMGPDDNPFRLTLLSRSGMTLTIIFIVAAGITAGLFWRIAIREPNS